MHAFISRHARDNWLVLEFRFALKRLRHIAYLFFSSLGFIGKLFRAADMPLLVQFVLLFYKDKPVDWLLAHLFYVKYCSPEKPGKECTKVGRGERPKTHQKRCRSFARTSFSTSRLSSNMSAYILRSKEKYKSSKSVTLASPSTIRHTMLVSVTAKHQNNGLPQDNPHAIIATTLKTYQKYDIEKAYNGETFFWALLPQPGDFIRFDFSPPVRLNGEWCELLNLVCKASFRHYVPLRQH